jgi:hypothetical protein
MIADDTFICNLKIDTTSRLIDDLFKLSPSRSDRCFSPFPRSNIHGVINIRYEDLSFPQQDRKAVLSKIFPTTLSAIDLDHYRYCNIDVEFWLKH